MRYLVVQDAGRAFIPHMLRVSSKGVLLRNRLGLNEEYIYGDDGKLQNAGFLDYRVPVSSDLPMIDTVIVEVPSDSHPFGAESEDRNSATTPGNC